MHAPDLTSLLKLWQQAFSSGQDIPVEQLCPECPRTADALRQAIATLRRHTNGTPPDEDPDRTTAPGPAFDLPETASLPANGLPDTGPDPWITVPRDLGQDGLSESEATDGPPGYAILGELGRGGMGVVYRARQFSLNRVVALKMILAGSHAGPDERARLLVEAEAIAAIKHPGIVQIFDFGTHGDLPYFSMEFCPGGSLTGKLSRASLPPLEAAALVEQIARAVHAAHQAGIVHRDLKPGNVLLAADGSPRVTDFGLARRVEGGPGMTGSGAVVGTPSYMPPEQASGQSREAGPLADVWALGAILFECLAGRPPFKAASSFETILQVLHEEPIAPRQLNPGVPTDLETICLKCLQKEPERRYPSASDLADDLRRWRDGEPISARPISVIERALKWTRRHPWKAGALGAGTLALAGLLTGIVFFGLYKDQQSRALLREIAQRQQMDRLWHQGQEAFAIGREAIQGQKDPEARKHLDEAQGALERALDAADQGNDLDARDQIASQLDRVRQEVRELAARQEQRERETRTRRVFQERVAQLDQTREELLFRTLTVTDGDRASQHEMIRKLAESALAPLEILPVHDGLGRFAPLFRDAQQRRALAAGCAEILVLWAESEPARALQLLAEAERLLAAERLPVPRSLFQRRAAQLAARGDQVGATQARAQAAKQEPVSALDHFLLALEAYHAGKPNEAIASCEAALRLRSDYFWPQYLHGVCHLRAGSWEKADAWLSASLSRRPNLFWPRVQRATARVQMKDLEGAGRDLSEAIGLAKQPLERYVARLGLAGLAFARKQWGDARDELKLAIACQPERAVEARMNLAQVWRKLGNRGEAIAELDRVVERRPDDAQLYHLRAEIYLEKGDLQKGRKDLEVAITRARTDPGPWLAAAHVKLGYLKYEAGDPPAALAEYETALRLQPDYSLAHRQRAEALLALGKQAEAGKALDAMLAKGKGDALVWQARGMIHASLREYAQAVQAYSRSLQIERNPDVLAYRGWAFLQSQALSLASDDFEEVLKSRPGHADARCGRAQIRVLAGKVEDAVADAEAAWAAGKKTPVFLCNLATVYVRAARRVDEGRNPRRPPSAAVKRYEDRAVDLVVEALKRTPEPQRARFWREHVERDRTFRVLLGHPALRRLTPRP